jgi:23S rRNA (cytosine1962-C5)-methyltransferase
VTDKGRTYRLLDAGEGRRLERFGEVLVDRPAPTATDARRARQPWASVGARFDDGRWAVTTPLPDPWLIDVDGLTLELRPTDAGQVGLFPEHAALWPWLSAQGRPDDTVLHLFAYTGATTLALGRSGLQIVHVDASRPAVAWARRNAARSGLVDRPIRWIVDDALTFVVREARRSRRYRGFVVDPPTYGHGPNGRRWRLSTDLDPLLRACAAIATDDAFVLVTAHTPGEEPDLLGGRLRDAFPGATGRIQAGPLQLTAESGATLRLGAWAGIMARR